MSLRKLRSVFEQLDSDGAYSIKEPYTKNQIVFILSLKPFIIVSRRDIYDSNDVVEFKSTWNVLFFPPF